MLNAGKIIRRVGVRGGEVKEARIKKGNRVFRFVEFDVIELNDGGSLIRVFDLD